MVISFASISFISKVILLKFFTNSDAQGIKRSLIKWASSFHKVFSKIELLYMNAKASNISSLNSYEVLWNFWSAYAPMLESLLNGNERPFYCRICLFSETWLILKKNLLTFLFSYFWLGKNKKNWRLWKCIFAIFIACLTIEYYWRVD